MERWFRELKDRTKRFYHNMNLKDLESVEELVSAEALLHNVLLDVVGEGGEIRGVVHS